MHRRLLTARDTGAVVVTTPTAVKAFMLKFVEILHVLDKASVDPKSIAHSVTSSLITSTAANLTKDLARQADVSTL
jgi:hypothetical protein